MCKGGTMADVTSTQLLPKHEFLSAFRSSLDASLFRSLARGIDTLREEFGPEYLADFDLHLRLLHQAHPERPWPNWAANGYISFNRMVLKEELAFRDSGAYSAGAEDMDRIIADIYDNDDVMEKYYLVGLYATYFVWPHHYRMLRYYRSSFLGAEAGEAARFAEWGVGHGLLSVAALSRWPAAQGWLFDLSQHSLNFARRLLEAAGHGSRCSFVQGDVVAEPDLPVVDRLVCSEVLEHVPYPQTVLEGVRSALAPGGRAFLTAAVDAPQVDHVYLFRSDEEVFAMAAAAGLRLRSHLSVVHPNRTSDPRPPRVVGMVVEAA
jgi:SAM-dependent methyltransferase